MPNNFYKLLPIQSGELTIKRSLIYTELFSAHKWTMALRSARRSYLKELDPIHHQSQRLILGAFRTFPINSLYAKAPEAPLQIRSEKLALQYYTKLKSCLSNPAHDCTVNPKYRKYFEKKEKEKKKHLAP